MVAVGPAPIRSLPRRKAQGRGGRWEVLVGNTWIAEEVVVAAGQPLSEPIHTVGAGPISVRHVEPEVAPPTPPPTPEPVAKRGATPTRAQREAWRLCHDEGIYWPDAAKAMGSTAWAVSVAVKRYMELEGIKGDPPGRMPKAEATRRAMAGRTVATSSTPAPANPSDSGTVSIDEEPSEPSPELQVEAPHATEPASDLHLATSAEPMETPASPSSADFAMLVHLPSREPAQDPDFLTRLDAALEHLIQEDARERHAMARRIERLRDAGDVYRAAMAGRVP